MTNGGRPGNEVNQERLKAQIRCYTARFGLIAVVENKTDSRDPAALRKQPSHRTYSLRPSGKVLETRGSHLVTLRGQCRRGGEGPCAALPAAGMGCPTRGRPRWKSHLDAAVPLPTTKSPLPESPKPCAFSSFAEPQVWEPHAKRLSMECAGKQTALCSHPSGASSQLGHFLSSCDVDESSQTLQV